MCIRDRSKAIETEPKVPQTKIVRPSKKTDVRNCLSLNSNAEIACLLYTSDAADERSSVDLGGRRIIKKKKKNKQRDKRIDDR